VHSPVLVVTAEHDRLIPHAHSERLVAELRGDLVTVIDVGGTNHDSVVRAPAYRAALETFLSD
jgi:alpha-beta hydrolase superfamily lysophospholipase